MEQDKFCRCRGCTQSYKRGRLDAAQAIENMVLPEELWKLQHDMMLSALGEQPEAK